jgi:hypothetical protein
MSQKILLISGKKQSGKDSAANYLTGYLLKKNGIIKKYSLDEEGKLLIDIQVENPETQQIVEEWGLLDLNRRDIDYSKYADKNIWPIIKPEHFGDILKEVVMVLFGLERENIWGSNEDKNKLTHVKWKDVYKLCPNIELEHLEENREDEFLTHRELLEVFGTDICRILYNDCWVQALFKNIVFQGYPFVVIADCRFPHEIEYAKSLGAKTVRLTRNILNGKHLAETALDNYTGFDYVIDNQNMTQEEKGIELIKYLQGEGWIS